MSRVRAEGNARCEKAGARAPPTSATSAMACLTTPIICAGGDDNGPHDRPEGPEDGAALDGFRSAPNPHRPTPVLARAATRGQHAKNPEASRPRGSNVTLMAGSDE